MTTDLDVVDLSRRRFGITTVFHYIFAPLTIGLAPMAAIMQTIWERTGHERWYRATRFFGNLFLINLAMGVVTGIMQEFQLGMNWPEYASFVGDVFDAPLAFEGLAAFSSNPSSSGCGSSAGAACPPGPTSPPSRPSRWRSISPPTSSSWRTPCPGTPCLRKPQARIRWSVPIHAPSAQRPLQKPAPPGRALPPRKAQ